MKNAMSEWCFEGQVWQTYFLVGPRSSMLTGVYSVGRSASLPWCPGARRMPEFCLDTVGVLSVGFRAGEFSALEAFDDAAGFDEVD